MLALALGGRTIAEWKSCMEQPEFLLWVEFFKLYPFDDYHRYHRPAALVSQSMAGGDMRERLEWLQPNPTLADMTASDIETMRAFGYAEKGN